MLNSRTKQWSAGRLNHKHMRGFAFLAEKPTKARVRSLFWRQCHFFFKVTPTTWKESWYWVSSLLHPLASRANTPWYSLSTERRRSVGNVCLCYWRKGIWEPTLPRASGYQRTLPSAIKGPAHPIVPILWRPPFMLPLRTFPFVGCGY